MKNLQSLNTQTSAEARFALRVTARLSESAETLPSDITQRLRIARQQALQLATLSRVGSKPAATVAVWAWVMAAAGGSSGGAGESSWWNRLAAFLPLVVLVIGLLFIQELHSSRLIAAAADIDAALLADDLPPDAYQDGGFLEFLKRPPTAE